MSYGRIPPTIVSTDSLERCATRSARAPGWPCCNASLAATPSCAAWPRNGRSTCRRRRSPPIGRARI